MLGVDLVIPDVTYLEKIKKNKRISNYTWPRRSHWFYSVCFKAGRYANLCNKVNNRSYKNKLEEHKLLRKTKLKIVEQGQTINFGKIKVEFIRSCHSIPDSVMLAIHTPVGTVMHTGDFKIDHTPIDGKLMDLGRIAEIGNKGVLALMSDSTNSERKGYTMSESSVGEVLISYS